jgi:hypothetical protein
MPTIQAFESLKNKLDEKSGSYLNCESMMTGKRNDA